MDNAPNEGIRLQLRMRHSDLDSQIWLAADDRANLEREIAALEFIVEQIEKAVESPIYRKQGKREIGVHIHRDYEDWLKKRKNKASEV